MSSVIVEVDAEAAESSVTCHLLDRCPAIKLLFLHNFQQLPRKHPAQSSTSTSEHGGRAEQGAVGGGHGGQDHLVQDTVYTVKHWAYRHKQRKGCILRLVRSKDLYAVSKEY